MESASPVAYYADCVATDTPIPGGPKSPGAPYFGCKDAVEVSSGGRTVANKAFTGRIGNGRNPPPGTSPLSDAPGVPTEKLRYTWEQNPHEIEPYGRAATVTDIDNVTADTRDFSPLGIKTCAGTPNALPNATSTCAATAFDGNEVRPYALITVGSPSPTATNCDSASPQHCRSYAADATAGGGVNLANVTARLKQIFAATFSLFQYQPQDTVANVNADYLNVNDSPTPVPESDTLVYDISDTVGHPPIVRAVGSCNTQGQCLEGTEGQITLNGVEDGNVTGGNGFKQATLRFFGYAQNDQMPIRNVIVDWGDGTNLSGNNPDSAYKNHRGYEQRRGDTGSLQLLSKCDESTFSTSADACDSAAPFSFSHAYSCNSDGSARCADRTNNCVRTIDGRDACVYKPKVQITDNWGFCNGVCTGGPAGDACYNARTNGSLRDRGVVINECDFSTAADRGGAPYTPFAGQIVVYPRD